MKPINRNDLVLGVLTKDAQSAISIAERLGITQRQANTNLNSLRLQGKAINTGYGWIIAPERDAFSELEDAMRKATRSRIEKEKVASC